VQQSHFQRRKRFCCVATAFAVQETILLNSKVNSRAGNGFAMQQRRFQYWKSFSCAAASLPGLEIILLFRKTNSSTATAFAVQQRQFLRSNAFLQVRFCEGVNELSGEHIPLLEKEGWMRGQKHREASLVRADGVVSSAKV
jgi:hypothetical protein